MPTLYDVVTGPAKAEDINQAIQALKGTSGRGTPVALVALNDPANWSLAVKNLDSGSKALVVYKADGTVLLQVDQNGVKVSPDGTAAAANLVTTTATQTLTAKTLTSPTENGGTYNQATLNGTAVAYMTASANVASASITTSVDTIEATTAAITVTLPNGDRTGRMIDVINSSAGVVYLSHTANIGNPGTSTTYSLPAGASVTLCWNGSAWRIR